MNFIESIKLVASLLPTIIELIKSIEEAIPGTGNGEQKLAAVRGILETIVTTSEEYDFSTLWGVLAKVISTLVSVFNSTGVFNK